MAQARDSMGRFTSVAEVGVTFGADTSGFDRGIQHVESGISGMVSRMGSGLQSFGQSMTGFGLQLTAMTAPLVALGAVGIRTASSFEDSMAEISARAGITGDDLEEVRQFALQMGADTAFSAQDAARGMLQLLASGQDVKQAMRTLRPVLDAAAASGEDLGMTADMVTDVMAAFGLEVDDAQTVVDALARAAGASSADIASLGQGIGNVGNVASMFGLTVEDTAAVLAIFSENGIKGAEAGTQLRSMLTNLSRTTPEVQAAWEALGTSLYDMEGNVRPLSQVIAELDTALDGLPAEEQNRLMQELAGTYGIMGLSALRGSIDIDTMKDSMAAQASAADVANARLGTFSGKVESLQGSIETLMIEAFTPFMKEVLTPLAEKLTDIVNSVTDWAKENPKLSTAIFSVVLAVAALGVGLTGLGLIISGVGVAAGLAGAALGLLFSPITLAIIAVAALGAALYYAYKNNIFGFRDAVDELIPKLKVGLALAFGAVKTIWETVLKPALDAISLVITDTVIPAISELVNFLKINLPLAFGFLRTIWETVLKPVFDAIWITTQDAVIPVIEAMANAIKFTLGFAFGFLRTIWETVLKPVFDDIAAVYENVVKEKLQNLYDFFQVFIPNAMRMLKDVWENTLRPALQELAGWIQANVFPVLRQLYGTFIRPIINGFNQVAGAIDSVIGKLREVQNVAGAGQIVGSGFVNALSAALPGRAVGGPVSMNQPYVVGELGPEIFVPNTSGRIIPNSRSDFGGGGVSVNVYGDVYDQRSLDNLVDRINRVVMMRAGA